MKILFIVPYAPDRIRVRPYNLIKELVRRGHEVTLATLWSTPAELDGLRQIENAGVKILACRLAFARSVWNSLGALSGSRPFQSVYAWQPELAGHIHGDDPALVSGRWTRGTCVPEGDAGVGNEQRPTPVGSHFHAE